VKKVKNRLEKLRLNQPIKTRIIIKEASYTLEVLSTDRPLNAVM
jgi:hypothetical protein